MKLYFSFLALYSLLLVDRAMSQSTPAVEFSSQTATQILGAGGLSKTKRILNCTTLLNKDWGYPNAQVTGFCYDAETACLRYGLIISAIKYGVGEAHLENLKKDLALAVNDVALRLRGCQLAIEASVTNPGFLRQMTTIFLRRKENY